MVNEMKRVCRPGGTIVVVNHFTTTSPIWGKLTKSLDPITRRLGWSTNLELKPFLEEAAFTDCKAYRYSRSSLYTVVVGTNDKEEGLPTHATETRTPSSPGAPANNLRTIRSTPDQPRDIPIHCCARAWQS